MMTEYNVQLLVLISVEICEYKLVGQTLLLR
jgi:hypothetical protein